MDINLKKAISLAERSGWDLDYFEDHYAVVSRVKDSVWKRKCAVLVAFANIKCELQSCDDYAVLIMWF